MALSSDTLQKLDQLYQAQDTYQPSSAIAAQLATKTVLTFVGPTCVGKNTIMEATAEADKHFKIVGTFTSRESRLDDRGYTYYENTDGGLRQILADIAQHRVVQYAVNPYAHTLYGSVLADYPGDFNLADVFSGAVSQFRQLGFQRTIAISVVTDPAVWLKRFDERFPAGHLQRKARRDEAIESINWSLTQTNDDRQWVVNVDGQPETTAQQIIRITSGPSGINTEARKLARAMLKTAQEISA